MARHKLEKMPPEALRLLIQALQRRIEELNSQNEVLKRMDREASQVESIITMRTKFTGNKPYVGWKGLALALEEALDERDYYRVLSEQYHETVVRPSTANLTPNEPVSEGDDDVGC